MDDFFYNIKSDQGNTILKCIFINWMHFNYFQKIMVFDLGFDLSPNLEMLQNEMITWPR